MPKGPKGEYRPVDPIQSGNLVMRIAVGDITEAQARAIVEKDQKRRAAKRKKPSKSTK